MGGDASLAPEDRPPADGADHDVVPVRAGDELDWDALAAHLRRTVGLPDGPLEVAQFSAGRANLTYRVAAGGRRLVVRRPPKGTIAPGAHDMAREHRVLSRLWRAYPRAPRALDFCDDESVIGAPFVVIELRDGVVVRDTVPEAMAHHPDVERRIDLALVDAVADLHLVEPGSVDLAGLGRPDGYAGRQVAGWTDRWRRVAPQAGLEVVDQVAAALAREVPEPTRASIVHNDLKLDNCQLQADDPDTITSVFDWDMATVGDPLFDLALVLTSMGSTPVWVLDRDEALGRYASRTGIDPSSIDWYLAFATWRTVVVMQQLYARYTAGDSSDDRLAELSTRIPMLAEQARELLPR